MSGEVFVWDTTGPLHASRVGHLDWLLEAAGPERRHMIPSKVAEEMSKHGYPADTERLEVHELGELEDLLVLARWQERLGADEETGLNEGEAWVATLAERTQAVAVIDDRHACEVIQRAGGVEVHGVLWAISLGVLEKRAPGPSAYSGLCDQMMSPGDGIPGIRWPIKSGGYPAWFEKNRRSPG